MLEQPFGTFELSLEHCAIEGMVKIARSELGYGFDDFEPAEVGGMAHRRTPIAAPDRNVKQLWI